MVNNPPQNPPPGWTALLTELQRIAEALESPRFDKVADEAPPESAPRNVDYLALRQLMGHQVRQGDKDAVFPAALDRRTKVPELVLGPVPEGAAKVAVFLNRGEPAEEVDLSKHTFDLQTRTPTGHPLKVVTKDQVVTRLEFRRADGYPLALGPRLPVV